MTDQIWKYHVSAYGVNAIQMPQDAEVLTVQIQGGRPVMWARVDPDADSEERIFHLTGTGHALPDALLHSYVGTVQQGAFVWHLFEIATAEGVGQ